MAWSRSFCASASVALTAEFAAAVACVAAVFAAAVAADVSGAGGMVAVGAAGVAGAAGIAGVAGLAGVAAVGVEVSDFSQPTIVMAITTAPAKRWFIRIRISFCFPAVKLTSSEQGL
jgi:hypothetical protein